MFFFSKLTCQHECAVLLIINFSSKQKNHNTIMSCYLIFNSGYTENQWQINTLKNASHSLEKCNFKVYYKAKFKISSIVHSIFCAALNKVTSVDSMHRRRRNLSHSRTCVVISYRLHHWGKYSSEHSEHSRQSNGRHTPLKTNKSTWWLFPYMYTYLTCLYRNIISSSQHTYGMLTWTDNDSTRKDSFWCASLFEAVIYM